MAVSLGRLDPVTDDEFWLPSGRNPGYRCDRTMPGRRMVSPTSGESDRYRKVVDGLGEGFHHRHSARGHRGICRRVRGQAVPASHATAAFGHNDEERLRCFRRTDREIVNTLAWRTVPASPRCAGTKPGASPLAYTVESPWRRAEMHRARYTPTWTGFRIPSSTRLRTYGVVAPKPGRFRSDDRTDSAGAPSSYSPMARADHNTACIFILVVA